VLASLAGAGIEVVEYTPATVKKSVTGTGGADKVQVAFMVIRTLGPEAAGSCGDRADALAVALCHLFRTGGRLRLQGPTPVAGAGPPRRRTRPR
jgi:crossover junction endodeoxyribonuclease RuvC